MCSTTNDQHQLAVLFVTDPCFWPLFLVFLVVAAPDEISAGVMGVKAGGIDGGMLHALLSPSNATHRDIHQRADALLPKQPAAGLLQRGVMRHRSQAKNLLEFRPVDQKLANSAIVLLLKLLENQ